MSDPTPRLSYADFKRAAPAAYAGLAALSKAVVDSGLDRGLLELVKLRASQLNACAFCLQFHLNEARRLRVAEAKLDLLAVWREAGVFTAREAAALAWTEALSVQASAGASDANYAALLAQFSASEAMYLTVAIGTINQWNRIAVGLRFAPEIPGVAA